MKIKLIAAALLFGTSSYAMAADAVVDEVVVVDSSYDWSGVYVGGQGGYLFGSDGWLSYDYSQDNEYFDFDPEGAFGGAQLGYNHHFLNNLVLGVETDVNIGTGGTDAVWWQEDAPFATSGEFDLKWFGSTRIRAGYAFDRWLPFATVGVAYGHLEFADYTGGELLISGDTNLVGWTLGTGVNFAMIDNIIVGGEYRYTDFSHQTFTAAYANGFPQVADVDLDFHDVRFSIAYKF